MSINIDNIAIPKQINPCPIAEAVVELRFDSDFPFEAIIGLLFNSFKEKFPDFSKLPIMEFPAFVRENDPALKFAPYYRLSNKDFIFQIGRNSFSIACPKEYKGWSQYYEQTTWVFDTIKNLKFVKNSFRLGLRYINFFPEINIFEKIKINLSLAENSLISNQNVLRSEFDINDFHCVVILTNTAKLDNKTSGSSIDIDIIYENNLDILKGFNTIVSSAHELEKKMFFSILKEDFLKKYHPEF